MQHAGAMRVALERRFEQRGMADEAVDEETLPVDHTISAGGPTCSTRPRFHHNQSISDRLRSSWSCVTMIAVMPRLR